MAITSEKVKFPGSQGFDLAARLDLPDGDPRAYALFAHCFTCSKDIFAASRIARSLADLGIAVLRFDFTGLGMSDGEFANTNFSSNVQDLVHAAEFLKQHYQAPQIIVGHSLGGAAVLAAAGRIPDARAIVTINAPCTPEHVTRLFSSSSDEIEARGEARVTLAGREFTIKKQFLDDISEQRMDRAIRELGRALLVFHAPQDDLVGIDNARRIFELARHPKSFCALDGADHLISKKPDAVYLANVLAAWASRYIEAGPASAYQDDDALGAEEGLVVVSETRAGKFENDIQIGRHRLRADEPSKVGGNDSGPSPYDLVLAGLGACTAMTLRLYAEHKKLSLDRVTVELKHEKIHAEDCGDCETKAGKIDRISREIRLEGDLDESARAGLLRIADKCPVHRTLHSEVLIETSERR